MKSSSNTPESAAPTQKKKTIEEIEAVTIRFGGDSGDGVQLTGGRFTSSTALAGNDLACASF